MSPEDMQRYEIHPLESAINGLHLGMGHDRCPEGWVAFLDDQVTLAELVQRAEEHGEVCR